MLGKKKAVFVNLDMQLLQKKVSLKINKKIKCVKNNGIVKRFHIEKLVYPLIALKPYSLKCKKVKEKKGMHKKRID